MLNVNFFSFVDYPEFDWVLQMGMHSVVKYSETFSKDSRVVMQELDVHCSWLYPNYFAISEDSIESFNAILLKIADNDSFIRLITTNGIKYRLVLDSYLCTKQCKGGSQNVIYFCGMLVLSSN